MGKIISILQIRKLRLWKNFFHSCWVNCKPQPQAKLWGQWYLCSQLQIYRQYWCYQLSYRLHWICLIISDSSKSERVSSFKISIICAKPMWNWYYFNFQRFHYYTSLSEDWSLVSFLWEETGYIFYYSLKPIHLFFKKKEIVVDM